MTLSNDAKCAASDKLSCLLLNRSVTTYFQPIISIRQHTVTGYEALSRGIDAYTGATIMPNILFPLAAESSRLVALDRLCREKAFETFNMSAAKHERAILFLNLETSIIDSGVVGSGHLINSCLKNGINPASVAIEINESKVHDLKALETFIQSHKQYGFLFALDDVGNGHSNLDRILQVKPDIIKIDRCLVSNINQDYYKQEIFKCLAHLGKKVGSQIVAEGIETEDEALTALQLGADMLQGYYFAKPVPVTDILPQSLESKIRLIASLFKTCRLAAIKNQFQKKTQSSSTFLHLLEELSKTTASRFDGRLYELMAEHPRIQYLYILNMAGVQITDTVGSSNTLNEYAAVLYQSDQKGTDQSLKDYCLIIQAGMDQYISEPYMSMANGRLCVTYSKIFRDAAGNSYILCADFDP
ncbi:EAL domain-containing protein [Sporomusa aerivorans]|uniref:EAL domain-containing protein n=1 Tax=Sporomusa aerivorans TaxID=204936 RepID=UPI003529FB9F